MIHNYKITIALLTYNRCKSGYLKEALEAILAQTYTDFELLVVDNHSTDTTAKLVMSYEDPRLTYIQLPAGGNATNSYIRSSIMSRGEYIIMAHDDDVMEPTMIERQMAFVEKYPELLVVSNNVSLMNEDGVMIQARLYELEKDMVFNTSEYVRIYLEEKLWIPAPTLLFKRENFVKAVSKTLGTKDPAYLASGDIWLLFTLNLQGPIALLADPLLRYRQHRGQESRNVDQGYPMIEAVRLLLKNHRRKNNLQSNLPAIHGFLTRFRTQDICFKSTTKNQVVRKLTNLKNIWEKNVIPSSRAMDTILPFEICLYLFGLESSVPAEAFSKLKMTLAKSGGRRGFRNWLSAIQNGKNIFDSQKDLKKIAVFGSMLNTYLITESALQSGIEVLGCFDSSPARIGKQVLGISIYPIADLSEKSKRLDAIILSSEHDQEDALKLILKKHLQQNQNLPIISWKDLAEGAAKLV